MTLPFAIPDPTTPSLTLRAPRESDLDAMAAFGASDRAAFVGGPHSRFDAWTRLLSGVGHWACAAMVIGRSTTAKSAGRWQGASALGCMKAGPSSNLAGTSMTGSKGRGWPYEAAMAVRDHAAKAYGFTALISLIDPANTRSAALAARHGGRG